MMQVIRQFQDHGLQFQILQVLCRDARKAQSGSQQISRYCPCGVAVTAMVHRGDQSPVKVVFIFQGAVDGDGQGLLRKPIRAEGVYGDDRLGVLPPGTDPPKRSGRSVLPRDKRIPAGPGLSRPASRRPVPGIASSNLQPGSPVSSHPKCSALAGKDWSPRIPKNPLVPAAAAKGRHRTFVRVPGNRRCRAETARPPPPTAYSCQTRSGHRDRALPAVPRGPQRRPQLSFC